MRAVSPAFVHRSRQLQTFVRQASSQCHQGRLANGSRHCACSRAWRRTLGIHLSHQASHLACQNADSSLFPLLADVVAEDRLLPTIVGFNAAISACDKAGPPVRKALLLVVCSVHFTKAGFWQGALQLLAAMPLAQFKPDTVSFFFALGAPSRFDRSRASRRESLSCQAAWKHPLCERWQDKGYNAAISACAGSGEWQHALHILEQLERSEHAADAADPGLGANSRRCS